MGIIIAVTGHRPEKLGGYKPAAQNLLISFAMEQLRKRSHNLDLVITGMALGWDMAIADACLSLGIPFEAAIPMPDQARLWPQHTQERWMHLRSRAVKNTTVCEGPYENWKMQKRNEHMVNQLVGDSDLLLALWNGTPGGTKNCVSYAKSVNKKIENVWNDWQSFTWR